MLMSEHWRSGLSSWSDPVLIGSGFLPVAAVRNDFYSLHQHLNPHFSWIEAQNKSIFSAFTSSILFCSDLSCLFMILDLLLTMDSTSACCCFRHPTVWFIFWIKFWKRGYSLGLPRRWISRDNLTVDTWFEKCDLSNREPEEEVFHRHASQIVHINLSSSINQYQLCQLHNCSASPKH